MAKSFEIAYAAHTASCSFLLDSEGFCRRVVVAPKGKAGDRTRTAARCVGAQYVASLDLRSASGLLAMPRAGAVMLFARVDSRGRIALVRTGTLVSFESRSSDDPFLDSHSVSTSAPALTELESPKAAIDGNEHTQKISSFRASRNIEPEASDHGEPDLATAEYAAVTERQPEPVVPTRTVTLRRRDLAMRVPNRIQHHWPTEPPAPKPERESDVQLSRRRHG